MAVAWPVGVNTDAYGMEASELDNVERVEFESGKERIYLKNSSPRKTFSFLLSFEDVGADSEYKLFVAWWNDVLLSGAMSFNFPDLLGAGSDTEYMVTGPYSARGQKRKEISLSVVEA